MRAKMQLTSKVESGGGVIATFEAFYGDEKGPFPENLAWAQSTPFAKMQMQINNPAAYEPLIEGKQYFVDFTPAE